MFLANAQSWGGSAELSRGGYVYSAYYSVTGLSAYTATSGNPLLYNGSGPLVGGTGSKVVAILLSLSVGWTTAPGATGVVGVGMGVTGAPSTTTGVTKVTNTTPGFGNATPQCLPLNAGTVTAATGFIPTHNVSTGVSQPSTNILAPLEGLICLYPGSFINIAGSASIATMVATIGLTWAEVPLL